MKTYILPITWYIEHPIDFEHKQYILFSYLQKVDKSFMKKKLSPHYLNIEKLLNELYNNSYDSMISVFNKEKYVYFEDNKKIDGYDNELIVEIKNIVDFSIPQLENRIDYAKFILNRNKQILY
jgi:hypothetical protein